MRFASLLLLASLSSAAECPAGAVLVRLDEVRAVHLGLAGGVEVASVAEPAAQRGLRPGDVILAADGTPVRCPVDLRSRSRSGGVLLTVVRNGVAQRLVVPVAALAAPPPDLEGVPEVVRRRDEALRWLTTAVLEERLRPVLTEAVAHGPRPVASRNLPLPVAVVPAGVMVRLRADLD